MLFLVYVKKPHPRPHQTRVGNVEFSFLSIFEARDAQRHQSLLDQYHNSDDMDREEPIDSTTKIQTRVSLAQL